MTTLAREQGISAAPQAESTPKQPRRKSGVRRDLQGIRGLGIIFVVVGHLWRWPQGVYSMLDMFFVLSGFLITSVLIDSVKKYSGISFAQFYLSRVRRLMPMAVMVVLVTTAAFYLFYSSALGARVADDGRWALVFGVNWHFALDSTNYFSDQASSPLLHYWSLSVEEQFYLVWPAVVLVAMIVAHRIHLGSRNALFIVLGTITLIAFAYSMWDSAANPTVAYYSTFDRVWEFGIGGLIATARFYWMRMPDWLGLGLSWLGVLGLIVAIFTLTYGHAFPAPWGLPVVLLTGLVMIGGHGRSTDKLWLLDNPPMVYLGDISYSLYLWHLPVNIFLLGFIAHSSPWYYVTAIAVSLLLAVASYHLVERPLRYAPALMTRRERDFFANRPRRPGVKRGFTIAVTVCAASLAVVAALSGFFTRTPPASATPTGVTSTRLVAPATTLSQQDRALQTALGRASFPHFSPPLSQLGADHLEVQLHRSNCFSTLKATLKDCDVDRPDAARLALVVGDSFAIAWSPAVRSALEPSGWGVQIMAQGECPAWTLPSYVDHEGKPNPQCADTHRRVLQTVRDRHPELVILASASGQVRNATRRELATTPFDVAHDGLTRTIRALRAAGAQRIVVVGPPPTLGDLTRCVTRFGSPTSCIAEPRQGFFDDVDGESRAAAEQRVDYVRTQGWFCLDGSCPAFVGHTPVTIDGAHLTVESSESLGPLMRRALLGH